MPGSLEVADAVSKLINESNLAPPDASFQFSTVAVAPSLERIDSSQMRCFVEPTGRLTNETELQDSCTDEWAAQIAIVFVQKLDCPEGDETQPGGIENIRKLIELVESIADMLLSKTRLQTKKGTVRLDKSTAENSLVNREFLRQRVFYSEMRLGYG